MRLQPVPAAIFLCLTLAGCLPPPGPTGSADGDYRGTSTRTQIQPRFCPHPLPFRIPVRGGVMFYRWDAQTSVQAAFLSDGTVKGTQGSVRLEGTHDSAGVRGFVTNGPCQLHFTLKRVGGP